MCQGSALQWKHEGDQSRLEGSWDTGIQAWALSGYPHLPHPFTNGVPRTYCGWLHEGVEGGMDGDSLVHEAPTGGNRRASSLPPPPPNTFATGQRTAPGRPPASCFPLLPLISFFLLMDRLSGVNQATFHSVELHHF